VNLVGKKIKGNKIGKRETSPTRTPPAWPNTPSSPFSTCSVEEAHPSRRTTQQPLLPKAASSLPPNRGPLGAPCGPRTPPLSWPASAYNRAPTPPPSLALGPAVTHRAHASHSLGGPGALLSLCAAHATWEGYCLAAIIVVPAWWDPLSSVSNHPTPITRTIATKHPHPSHLAGLKPHNRFPLFLSSWTPLP
jgi:hypothetical protein